MQWKAVILAAATVIVAAAGPAWADCMPGAKIDSTTASHAKKKIEAAGYVQVHDLSKGCDNYWHGHAIKDGTPVNVVLSPQGLVMTEGD